MDLESGRGVQVVKVKDDHTYQLNKEALREILLREEVKDHPVVLVSVAGVYRGGKSFLLDFFLRYLYFQYTQKNNGRIQDRIMEDGSWLGSDDESLKGFSWRGGCKRDTTGLVLWSQPIHAILPSGEKVVVLLMDTQGTFDSNSTVRDCSTIFALSTLLSSVQIYNISKNIGEDHLQHLQLFAEYGRLVSNSDQKPFQKLKFIVRDWSYPYDYPFGAEGGELLIKEKMQVNGGRVTELQDLRKNIMSCFDDVSCFLMPYPGEAVASDPKFTGKLKDIGEMFKKALKELGPLLFEPQNMVVKKINGQTIKAKDLYHYFETYLDEFNSDKLPTPVTITRAMARAGLCTAKDQARSVYFGAMERVCDTSQPSLPSEILQEFHSEALKEALQNFKNSLQNVIGSHKSNETHFAQLEREFESKFTQYETINSAKTNIIIAKVKAAYEESIRSIGDIEKQCLHPRDLVESHEAAVEIAMAIFDSSRKSRRDVEDTERNAVLNELGQRLCQLEALNRTINEKAVSESRDCYFTYMENLLGTQSCTHRENLELKHQEALAMALDLFASMRIRDKGYQIDSYLSELKKEIDQRYGNIENINKDRNEASVNAAMASYNAYMGSICHQHLPCLHPEDLRQEHEEARDTAINEFHSKRLVGENESDNDEYKQKLNQELSVRYDELYTLNETYNETAVGAGVSAYDAGMTAACGPGQPRLSADQVAAAHTFATNNGALRIFYEKRRSGPEHSGDCHRDKLMQAVEERFAYYQQTNQNNPERPIETALEADESSFLETTLVVAGTAAIAAGVTAAVVATGGLAAVGAGAATAAGTAVTVEGVGVAATTAAGIAATIAATTWNAARRAFSRIRRRRRD